MGQPDKTPKGPEQTGSLSLLKNFETKLLRSQIERELSQRRHVDGGTATKIPKLQTHSAMRYIAAVAKAVQLGHLQPKQASAMLYAAQLLIAASKLDLGKPAAKAATAPKRVILQGITG